MSVIIKINVHVNKKTKLLCVPSQSAAHLRSDTQPLLCYPCGTSS